MINYEQAVHFLEGILRMPPNWRQLLQDDPFEFLTFYLKRHAIRIPFQNMEMIGVEPSHRWFPSEADIAAQGLCGRGGCCIHLNYFSMLIFRAIGLDTFVVRGDHYQAPVAGTHCMVMVKLHGPKHHGIYMVEAGGSYPILEPIPMDREKLPYRTLQAGGFPYEFREFAPGWIGKFHIGGGLMGGKYADKDEILRTSWDLKPRGLWEFDYPMLETFTNPPVSSLLRTPLMYRFFSNSEFKRLFPELPENANANKGKVLVSTRKSVGKISAASETPKVAKAIEPKSTILNSQSSPIKNGARTAAVNGKPNEINNKATPLNSNSTATLNNGNLKQSSKNVTSPKKALAAPESDEDEYEVVTEEEIDSSEEEDLEDPQNFLFIFKRRVIVGDAKSRKIVRNYDSYEEMEKDLKKFFPMVPADAVEKAIKEFDKFEVKPIPYDLIL